MGTELLGDTLARKSEFLGRVKQHEVILKLALAYREDLPPAFLTALAALQPKETHASP